MSLLLSDVERWGPERVTAALYKMSGPQSQHEWVVRVFDDYRYLILAPSQYWLDSVLPQHTLRLENRDIPIQEWDPSYAQGMRMIPIWIKVRGFPMMLWQTHEFEKLVEDFGAILLDQDPATENYRDWRAARLKIGICDPKLLPESHWIMFKDASGHVSRYDILFEIERAGVGSYFNPKRPRSEGGAWKPRPSGSGDQPPFRSGPGSTSSGPAPSSQSETTRDNIPPSSQQTLLSDPVPKPPVVLPPQSPLAAVTTPVLPINNTSSDVAPTLTPTPAPIEPPLAATVTFPPPWC